MTLRIAILTCALAALAPAQSGELFWYDNYPDALKEARETGKPIFLEYRCSP